MINEGDFVVCKRYYKENDLVEPFLPEVYYVVRNNTDGINGIISIFNSKNGESDTQEWTYFRTAIGLEWSFDSFYDYFYTLAEWRDKRINEILDNE